MDTGSEFDDGEVDLLGVLVLAVRGATEIVDEQRAALATHVDQLDALVELRDRALAIATVGDGQDVAGADLFAAVEGDELERARLDALFSRATQIPIPNPTT